MSELHPDRYFSGDAPRKRIARQLYKTVAQLPIISPHGHVPPQLFAAETWDWGTPVDMFIIPDHYVFRLLYSQGISLDALGIPRRDGTVAEDDHRAIWQTFADNWYLFRGTPTGIWLREAWAGVFGITRKLTSDNAQDIYDELHDKLRQPDYQPRRLYERFNIETLCTTDAATDALDHHRAIRASDWHADIRPTFRPDDVVKSGREGWRENIQQLSELTDIYVHDYKSYLTALKSRRADFIELGAVASDHDLPQPSFALPSQDDVSAAWDYAFAGDDLSDGQTLEAGVLRWLAEQAASDGLVMQLHIGSHRNHNEVLFRQYGRDVGADIPQRMEFTQTLKPLLNAYGNDANFRCIVFTLDESTYARELAPLAGHYPALLLGPPWWFHDSPNGMRRYFDRVTETAGIYNTAGFNDDTRAFCSIPARHDLWRRMSADWLAGLVTQHIIDEADAAEMIHALAYGLSKRAYRLDADDD